jgi:hypothetical protein
MGAALRGFSSGGAAMRMLRRKTRQARIKKSRSLLIEACFRETGSIDATSRTQ